MSNKISTEMKTAIVLSTIWTISYHLYANEQRFNVWQNETTTLPLVGGIAIIFVSVFGYRWITASREK